jgi:hypothetical protein
MAVSGTRMKAANMAVSGTPDEGTVGMYSDFHSEREVIFNGSELS